MITVNAATPAVAPYPHIARQLAEQGYAICDGFLDTQRVIQLRSELEDAWQNGCFRHAGVGHGENWELRPEIRSDKVLWLDEAPCAPAVQQYLAELESLRLSLNEQLYLGLMDFEGHFAVYPPGSFYHRHRDQFRGMERRQVTAILYLNDAWQTADGGVLRMYLEENDDSRYVDILPEAGRLVCFLSREFLHEVLPSNRNRYSVTGWFRQRP